MPGVTYFQGKGYRNIGIVEQELKAVHAEVRKYEEELRKEENELLFLEALMQRIRKLIDFFNDNFEVRVKPFLADVNSKEITKNPMRIYTAEIDVMIRTFAEIEFDLNTIEYIIKEMPKHYEPGKKLLVIHTDLTSENNKLKKEVGGFAHCFLERASSELMGFISALSARRKTRINSLTGLQET